MMLESLDLRSELYLPAHHIRLVLANVTDTARTLERSHLCGPIAGLVQAELVGASALLGSLLSTPGETLSIRIQLPDGLLKGALMEVSYEGGIRGYMQRKVLPSLDSCDLSDSQIFQRALGKRAQALILRSDAQGSQSHATVGLDLPDQLTITDIIEEYFNNSLQRRAFVQLSAGSNDGYVSFSRAFLCDFLPEANDEDYERVGEAFSNGSIQELLDGEAPLTDFARELHLTVPATPTITTKPIRFFCHCSSEKIRSMLRTLPPAELQALIDKGENTDIYCHMCGKCYTITTDDLKRLQAE